MINPLWKRILEISYKHKTSHVGSCLSCVDIIDRIYETKKPDDIFLLSCAHANLAWLVVLEKYFGYNADELFSNQGVHATKDPKIGILCSGGHLGQVFACSVGFALANPKKTVHVLISDGEWYSGIIQEGLNFIWEKNLINLIPHCNFNGYSALGETNTTMLSRITKSYVPWAEIHYPSYYSFKIPFLKGLQGHYHVLTDEDWKYLNEKVF